MKYTESCHYVITEKNVLNGQAKGLLKDKIFYIDLTYLFKIEILHYWLNTKN